MINTQLTFQDLKLSLPLLKALQALNFSTPSPVQAESIPHLLEGRDLIAQAQTGTGKTAAFALPILQQLEAESSHTQALILAPTRELAIQVAEQFKAFSIHQKAVTVTILCGGQPYTTQLKQLRAGAQIVVGTPGRILDHIRRKSLKLAELRTLVLDEADEMLRMGFIEDVETILAELPDNKQLALFSATMPREIVKIANRYLDEPASVKIENKTNTVATIEQRFLFASIAQKPEALLRILAVEEFQGVIVFVKTKVATDEVGQILQRQGFRAMAMNGDITQALREKIIAQFREGAIDILVATDVAARGLDVERVTHIINYDIPNDCETYIHRIGRTGRAGRAGVAILFVSPREARLLQNLERHIKQRIQKITVPSNEAVVVARQSRFLQTLKSRLNHKNIGAYEKMIQQFSQDENISLSQIAAAFALLFNQDKSWEECGFKQEFKESSDKNATDRSPRERGLRSEERYSRGRSPKGEKFSSPRKKVFSERVSTERTFKDRELERQSQKLFRLEVGRAHGAKASNIVGAIANESGLNSRLITGLKIHDHHSTVYLPKDLPKGVVQQITKAWVCGQQLKLSPIV